MLRFFDEIHTNENFSAIAVKDRITHELQKAETSPMEYARKAEFVLEVLTITDGLWNELSYAYKAREICEQIVERVRKYKIEVEDSTNNKQILKRLEIVQEFAQKQSVTFFRLQSDKFCDAMGVTDPKTREISRMTNHELAC
jgi:hypothetical protein